MPALTTLSTARDYSVLGNTVRLQRHPHVFTPSSHGMAFARILNVHKGETCADIGCGSGIFAIGAAKNGAIVTAIDPNKDALRMTRKNAKYNHVSVETVQGLYFANLRRKFDVIIANLPQDIVHPEQLEQLSRQKEQAINGGQYGDDIVRHLLQAAPNHMHERSRLYVPVYTGARHAKTQKIIAKNFHVTKEHVSTVECKDHVGKNIDFYLDLMKQGIIRITHRRGKWFARQHEYELQKKG